MFNFSENDIESLEVVYENTKVSFFKDKARKWQTSEGNSTTRRIIEADIEDLKAFFREMNSATIDQFLSTKIDETVLTNLNIGDPVYELNVKNSDSSTNSYYFNRTTDEDKMWTVIDQNNELVCFIQKDFNKLLKITSINFRTKNLLDEKFNPSSILLYNYDNNKSFSIDCNGTNAIEPLNNLSAETFINNAFSVDGTWVNGDWIPWKYSLSFSEYDHEESSGIKFFLSDRKGAGTWYGGDPKNKLIFQFPINVIDSLSILTENVKWLITKSIDLKIESAKYISITKKEWFENKAIFLYAMLTIGIHITSDFKNIDSTIRIELHFKFNFWRGKH